MADFEPRPLHLHTVESLSADLISGRAVLVGPEGRQFAFSDTQTRSALEWYRQRGVSAWQAAVGAPVAESLVDAIFVPPPTLPSLPARRSDAKARRLKLTKLEAHRFAGIHMFGTEAEAPSNYVHDFSSTATLFEGANGSGKTSIANAIIWALTGQVLRAQRDPQSSSEEFELTIAAEEVADGSSAHRITPVTPMPDPSKFHPTKGWIPADTWVELTFQDEQGNALQPLRRTQSRTSQGKVTENVTSLDALDVDPISLRIGTVIPGLLSLIKVGSESELGRAVAELTGLSALADLADHVRRSKQKIEKEFAKAKSRDIELADETYNRAKIDLQNVVAEVPEIAPPIPVPLPSSDPSLEATIRDITAFFEESKARTLSAAQEILGPAFDASDPENRGDLERNTGPALSELAQIKRLRSFVRAEGLSLLSEDELQEAEDSCADLLRQLDVLIALGASPDRAARARLYAYVALWLADHPAHASDIDKCAVCHGQLTDAVDPVSGKPIATHLADAAKDAQLVSQTIARWAEAAVSKLSRETPEALRREIAVELPTHPLDLMQAAIVDELFKTAPFSGVLGALKTRTAEVFVKMTKDRPSLFASPTEVLPAECSQLATALGRLRRAIAFGRWLKTHVDYAGSVITQVIGLEVGANSGIPGETLFSGLTKLNEVIARATPMTNALRACGRLSTDLETRRKAEKRIVQYQLAAAALGKLLELGKLTDIQVDGLRRQLSSAASLWRDRIYLGAFPSTAQKLTDAAMGRKGELGLVVSAGRVSAPAQHVANASALRASLVAFFLAFWEHVFSDRGGLRILLLDDSQELFDEGNRERLAMALEKLNDIGAQLVLTTYDGRFAAHLMRSFQNRDFEHRAVFPATEVQPIVRTPPSEGEIARKERIFQADFDAEAPAREYAEQCRVFIEACLSDLFDDPAYSAWVRATPAPALADYLNRIRALNSSSPSGMFGAHIFKTFVDFPGLAIGAPTLKLLNKAHHKDRRLITPAEVKASAPELHDLVKLADKLHDECRRWRQRASLPAPVPAVTSPLLFTPIATPAKRIQVCPDLAAFTGIAVGESQEPSEFLDPASLSGKAGFVLRRDNFGFAAPAGAIALVEIERFPINDRRLVIARQGDLTYARRLLRAEDSPFVGLAAETPDPRRSPRTQLVLESDVELYQVSGIVLHHEVASGQGREEAVQVDAGNLLEQVTIAYRVKEDSAVPLALPKQIVLGGPSVLLPDIDRYKGAHVALLLESGGSVFKRVGERLPGSLGHLRQFESIGGLGSSQIYAIERPEKGFDVIVSARLIIGVLYNA